MQVRKLEHANAACQAGHVDVLSTVFARVRCDLISHTGGLARCTPHAWTSVLLLEATNMNSHYPAQGRERSTHVNMLMPPLSHPQNSTDVEVMVHYSTPQKALAAHLTAGNSCCSAHHTAARLQGQGQQERMVCSPVAYERERCVELYEISVAHGRMVQTRSISLVCAKCCFAYFAYAVQ
eukprot:1159107-Pelagomonas_calceolata.AAC.3